MVPSTTEERGRGPSWARKYPPLLAMFVAAIIALAVLPSALNLPQANPSETLEYAPVPPEDDEPPPPPAAGNLASLGLASSPALNEGPGETGEGGTGAGPGPGGELAAPPDLPPPVELPPSVKTPSTKRCVGSPPRQTEDPLAPPCVASFNADNFGTTYANGVSREEVRILFYFDGYITDLATSRGNESRPRGEYFDLLDAPTEDEHVFIRMLRGYQRYFNDRFQTYDRFVHFYAYYSNNADYTPESRRAEAVDNYAKFKPFAVISYARENAEAYLETMARRGVLNFGSFAGRQGSFFTRYPKLIWGYLPALEVQAKQYASYVCQKIIPHPVSFSGNAADMTPPKPRTLGLLATSDPDRPELHAFRDLIKAEITACGGSFVIEKAFPRAGYAQDATTPPGYAADNMVAFQQAGVTTVIWAGGLETKQSQAAAAIGYRPEWVVAGDRLLESRDNALQQEQSVWRHSVVVSNVTLEGLQDEELCFLAHREADPDAPRGDVIGAACEFYDDLFQLFTGIQVAGPRLGPTSIDKGYHAIPRIASTNPKVPACFYNDNDYTCVKDAAPMFWDPDGRAPGASQNGCWRMPEGGKRYLTGTWPQGDAIAQRRPDDVCNSYAAGLLLSFAPPEVG